MVIKGLFFDLDDTIYDKSSYNIAAFEQIAEFISSEYDENIEYIKKIIIYNWILNGSEYKFLFNDIAQIINKEEEKNIVKKCVEIFHSIHPNLKLYDDFLKIHKKLKETFFMGIITDGNYKMQKNKINYLGLNEVFEEIIYTDLMGISKPNVIPFLKMLKISELNSNEVIFIGDNPFRDIMGALNANLYTIRILRGEFIDIKNIPQFLPHRSTFNYNNFQKIINSIDKIKNYYKKKRI